MKLSEFLIHTYREVPAEAEVISHQLMLRASMIQKLAAGIYSFLPLGWRVIKKIIQIVREEMDAAGGEEVFLPVLQPSELWHESGRWPVYGPELMRLKDRHDRDLCLGPTHEEVITDLVRREVNSYKQLPLNLYQIAVKFRDEIRPRFGLMRAREFIMKDAYSFDADEAGLEVTYQKMYQAYSRMFQRMNLNFRVVEADSGAIGGNVSHEFMILADTGEDQIAVCPQCQYAANLELAGRKISPEPQNKQNSAGPKLEKIATPNQKTVEEVAEFLKVIPEKLIKTLIYFSDNQPVGVLVVGDQRLSEVKLKRFLKSEILRLATDKEILQLTGGPLGFSGPIGLKNIKIIADSDVMSLAAVITGANEKDFHYKNVAPGRDFQPAAVTDLRIIVPGDPCGVCGAELKIIRGIEVGHIFKLGTKYSQKFEAFFKDEKGASVPFVMGCYGIGLTRLAAAAIEQNHDEAGIIWPASIAPFQTVVIPVNSNDPGQMTLALKIYQELIAEKIEVVLDDRDERAGVKFKDADLIGFPVKIIIGGQALKENKIEVQLRKNNFKEFVPQEKIGAHLKSIINESPQFYENNQRRN